MSSVQWATVGPPPAWWGDQPWAEWVEQSEVADCVRRAAAGEQEAWDAIVVSFSGLLWAIATGHRLNSADAAEVVQTIWLRLLENLEKIREPERLGGWLATTARRESLRHLKLQGRELVTDDATRLDLGLLDQRRAEHLERSPEAVTLDRDRDRRLWEAFAQLSDRCRQLLALVVIVAPPYAEVADAMDMPVGSIGPTRARCLERLRALLADDGIHSVGGM